ncbi:hypothetical protein CJF31_00005928 [Rutstroemia sp. NJR-2017a BVV2]|nr:hypothetical protein CJF31_00005928 [Rutstroemia sp. NJR-2017a BVV2]
MAHVKQFKRIEIVLGSCINTRILPYSSEEGLPSMEQSQSFTHDDYTVGWICALPDTELVVAEAMLDEMHKVLPAADPGDTNVYALGRIGTHNVVIACLPAESTGKVSAAVVAKDMLRSFRAIRFGLMVGIGGGAPYYGDERAEQAENSGHETDEEAEDSDDEEEDESIKDIRLGDVVVSLQTKSTEAVVQYDFGKSIQGGDFVLTGKLNKPPSIVLNAVGALRSKAIRQGLDTLKILKEMTAANPRLAKKFVYQGIEKDRLFKKDVTHLTDKKSCKACCGPNNINLVRRTTREDDSPKLHYGTIGSADQVMKDANLRDKWAKDKGIICFEMEAAGKHFVTFDQSDTANLAILGLMDSFPCLVIRGICDYADSHKNKVWQPYAAATAAAYAKELLHVIPGQQVQKMPQIEVVADKIVQHLEDWRKADKEELKQQRRTQDEEDCLQALCTMQYELQKNLNPARAKDTCTWCLEDPAFLDWRDRSTSRLLWLTADPGCGKSVLSRALVDERLIEKEGSNTTICYFFFKDTSESQRSSVNALSALLHQLFSSEKGAKLIEHAVPAFKRDKTLFAKNFEVLWSVVYRIARDPECGKIVFLVDALDECERQFREDFIKKLKIFEEIRNSSIEKKNNFQIFITSRPYWDIERVFLRLIKTFPNIRLQGERQTYKIQMEIDRVIEARVAELNDTIASRKARDLLLNGLSKVENRTYLWLYLVFKEIESKPRIDSKIVERLLRELPKTIQEAYEKILQRSSDQQDARRLLHIIVGATRPLSLREIGVALYITKETCSHEDLEIQEDEQQFGITIRDLCGLFITIIDGKVFLIHQTAKEFLVPNSDTIAPLPGTTWKQSLNPNTSSLILAECCLWYLSFEEFKKSVPTLTRRHETERYTLESDFLDYSARNWFTHFNGARNIDTDTKKLALIICDVSSSCFTLWFTIYYGKRFQREMQPEWNQTLFVTAYFGLGILTAMLLEESADFNITDSTGRTPLIWSAERGHEEVVKILLEAQADVNASGGEHSPGTALSAASLNGHEAVVKILLEAQADVNAQGGEFGNALQAASKNGYEAVVKILLEAQADINAQGGEFGNALQAASRGGYEAVVKILLEARADVNVQGGYYGNALQAACATGYEAVVKILLEARADVNAQGGSYGNALQAACFGGYEAVMKILLEARADVNAQGGRYGNALQAACAGGYEAVVKILLEARADVNAQGGLYGNALQAASKGGYEAVVKILLEAQADVNVQGGLYGNALNAACARGRKAIVKILLEARADVNAQGGRYGNALRTASAEGYEAVVKILLEARADVNAQGGSCGNALQAACAGGYEAVVKILLEARADVNAQGGLYGNAINAACTGGYEAVVKILLEARADVNAQGGLYGNTLQAACAGGYEAVVKILLEARADVNAQGGLYDNAISAACAGGHEAVVKILLNVGEVEVNSKDTCGYTPLSYATEVGNEAIVKMLLDTGKFKVDSKNIVGDTPLSLAIR